MKNALALLTGGNATTFTLLTRSTTDGLGPDQFLRVEGPLSTAMSVRDDATREDWTRDLHLLQDAETGTKLRIDVPWKYFRTVFRRGTPGLDILAARLGEHLGVMHRYFLEDGNNIRLSYRGVGGDWVHRDIEPIPIPFEGEVKRFTKVLEVNGVPHTFTYSRGLLDYSVKDPEAEEDEAGLTLA